MSNKEKKRQTNKTQTLNMENKLVVTRGEAGLGMGEVDKGNLETLIFIKTEKENSKKRREACVIHF